MTKKEYNFDELTREIVSHNFAPVYILMGEEPYFIDALEDLIVKQAINDDERDFNQNIFYGSDTKVDDVIYVARQFPMGAQKRLVVIKEAQDLNKLETLSHYVSKPMLSTILVICYKYKELKSIKNLMNEAKKAGIVFESKKIYDDKMPAFIIDFVKKSGLEIDPKSAQMLTDYIGNDISKLSKEIEKLKIILNNNNTIKITPDIIDKNIGISKEFNSFEFINAIASKDLLRAYRIADFFEKNKKLNPINSVLPQIFNYFVNLMICVYAKNEAFRTKKNFNIMQLLNIKWIQVKDYEMGLRSYNGKKIYNIIHDIRIADAKSKGFENANVEAGEIYKELLYKIMH